MKELKQHNLFDNVDDFNKWKDEWQDMPEFIQDDLKPMQQIIVSFETKEDVKAFSDLVGQKLTYKTKSIWFPMQQKEKPSNFIYTNES